MVGGNIRLVTAGMHRIPADCITYRGVRVGQAAQRDCSGCHRPMKLQISAVAFISRTGAPAGSQPVHQPQKQRASNHPVSGVRRQQGNGDICASARSRILCNMVPGGETTAGHLQVVCGLQQRIRAQHAGRQAAARSGAMETGQPLPNLGTCAHYRHSHRCFEHPTRLRQRVETITRQHADQLQGLLAKGALT